MNKYNVNSKEELDNVMNKIMSKDKGAYVSIRELETSNSYKETVETNIKISHETNSSTDTRIQEIP